MTNNKQMLLGLGFTGTFGANGKAWMSEDPVGEAKETADHLTEWFEAGAADGFWIIPDVFETDLARFVDEVVPILQERGVYHKDYEGNTLREHLGVPYQYGLDERLK